MAWQIVVKTPLIPASGNNFLFNIPAPQRPL